MIDRLLRRRFCSANVLLPSGIVRESHAHCTHAEEKLARVQFLTMHYIN